jgi:hypothetical protein
MSAIGTKRTSLVAVHMSAFRCKADMTSYSTRAKSRHRAPHGSFMLRAIFFGRSAVSSSSQFPGELGISHLVCGPDISMFSILASNSFSLWAVSK